MSGQEQGLASVLRREYGQLLTTSDLAVVLNYTTVQAVQRAIWRGRFPILTQKIEGRRGHFARVEDVASYLESLGGQDKVDHTTD